MDIKQLPAMISLLDDSDEEVVSIVENQFLLEGPSIIPWLEEAWFQLSEGPVSGKLAEIISRIQQQDLKHSFELLWKRPPISLLKSWMCLSRIQTPQLDESEVRQWVNGLKMDVWAQFGAGRDPMQQVATLNDVLFRQHGYRGNSDHYHAIENSLIHETLKRKMG
ncbi:MAG: transglutaminase family protein, partial [Bacteroidia bacterium]